MSSQSAAATAGPITVALCDDDPLARQSLAMYLTTASDIQLTTVHDNARDAVAAVVRDTPDVLLTDIRMPGLDGIAAAKLVAQQRLRTRVLLITSYDDENTVAALQAGASGYVLKSVTPAALVDAIRAVHRGLAVVSAGPLSELVPQQPSGGAGTGPDLSDEERTVLLLLCQGMTNAGIARHIFASESTVKRHLTSLMRKLGTSSRLTTVLEAQRLHLDQ